VTLALNTTQILLYGMGGHALVLMDACKEMGIEVVGYFDDQVSPNMREVQKNPLFLGPYRADCFPELPLLIAIGNNQAREKASSKIGHKQFVLIHPRATVSETALIGMGSVVLAGAIVQAGVKAGSHVIINAGAIIDHEVTLEDFSHIRPGAYVGGGARVSKSAIVPPLTAIERFEIFGSNQV
jgi:acetyltransferase EpsM